MLQVELKCIHDGFLIRKHMFFENNIHISKGTQLQDFITFIKRKKFGNYYKNLGLLDSNTRVIWR